jgi:CubicO group peptidase (beta-lactamase class C family)
MRALFLAALVACSSSSPAPQPPAGPVQKLAPLALALDEVVDKAIATDIVGAAIIVMKDGEVVYERTVGFADRETNLRVKRETQFRLASMSKALVSITALALVDEGKLGLDDPITKYLPTFRPKLPDGREPVIKVRHLLTHTSGLGYRFIDGGAYVTANISDGIAEPGMAAGENLRRLASVPLLYEPGTSWSYGLSIDVLGEVVAVAGGAPLPALVDRLVAKKLGMTSTTFVVTDRNAIAVPYVAGKPPVRMTEGHDVPLGDGIVLKMAPARIFDAGSFPSGGAGMAATARDYMLFLEAIRKGGAPILKPATARDAMTNQIGTIASPFLGKSRFGFGWGIDAGEGKRGAGTVGWGGVYGTGFFIDPAAKLSVVILTNVAGETTLENDITNVLYAR